MSVGVQGYGSAPPRRRSGWTLAAAVGVAGLAAAIPATAQQLPLKEAVPGAELICGPEAPPRPVTPPADASEVERLTNAATQAMILGDLDSALEFLDRALRADPTAAEAIYLRGRILQERGATEDATAAFCRYLAVAPQGPSSDAARERLDEALEQGAASRLHEAFLDGVGLYGAGRLQEAEDAFTEVLSARPGAGAARYNRGVVRAARGFPGPARSDLEQYLARAPAPADAGAVERFLLDLPGAGAAPTPGSAFAAGLFPGGGQYYTGRPALGVAVTAVAAGAVAAGVLHERTTIRCRDASLAADCPEELIASREKDRPLLLPAVGAAVGVSLLAAMEAAFHARRVRRERYERTQDRGAARLELDGRASYDGAAVHVGLLRLTF